LFVSVAQPKKEITSFLLDTLLKLVQFMRKSLLRKTMKMERNLICLFLIMKKYLELK